jgi:hypothetical protein
MKGSKCVKPAGPSHKPSAPKSIKRVGGLKKS